MKLGDIVTISHYADTLGGWGVEEPTECEQCNSIIKPRELVHELLAFKGKEKAVGGAGFVHKRCKVAYMEWVRKRVRKVEEAKV